MSKPKSLPREIFLLSLNGKSMSFELQNEQVLPDDDVLMKAGFGDDDFIVCPSKPKDYPAAPTAAKRVVVSSVEELGDEIKTPPIPKPSSKDSVLPKKSTELIISTNVYYPNGTSEWPVFVCVGKKNYWPAYSKDDKKFQWVSPSFPRQSLQYRRYWLNTFSVTVGGPQDIERAITTEEGMSKTKTKTLSGEVGVEIGGLSAKISASIIEEVTITESLSTTETYRFNVPSDKVAIWTLWQLVEKFVFVDENDKPIEWSGKIAMPGIKSKDPVKFINSFEAQLKTFVADQKQFDK